MNHRDNILDTTKFILILFVILGHVIPKLWVDKLFGINELYLSVSHATLRDDLGILGKETVTNLVLERDCLSVSFVPLGYIFLFSVYLPFSSSL